MFVRILLWTVSQIGSTGEGFLIYPVDTSIINQKLVSLNDFTLIVLALLYNKSEKHFIKRVDFDGKVQNLVTTLQITCSKDLIRIYHSHI